MRYLTRFLLSATFFLSFIGPGLAAATDPLFINMTTNEEHRSAMAIGFGKSQLDRGHPLTLFLNDKGVLLASKVNAAKYANQQKILSELVAKGAVVLVCPTCIKHYNVQESDLLPGLKVSNPDLTGGALFQDNTKALSW